MEQESDSGLFEEMTQETDGYGIIYEKGCIRKMDTALAMIQSWINNSPNKIRVIPRSNRLSSCEEVLGITEHSVLGTIYNHTGGLSVADGLIRHFGGNNQYNLSIVEANCLVGKKPEQIEGVLIVAVDQYSGLFGINIDYTGTEPGAMIYLPPESYTWFPMKIGHSDFVKWSMSDKVDVFFKDYHRIPTLPNLAFDSIAQYMPPLWSVDLSTNEFNLTSISLRKILAIRAGYLAAINHQFT